MENIQAVGIFKIKEFIKALQERTNEDEEEYGLIHYVNSEFERNSRHYVDVGLMHKGKILFTIEMKFRNNRDCSSPTCLYD